LNPAPAVPSSSAPTLADLEAEASALLSEAPGEEAEPQTVDFQCPFCDQMLHLEASLAGKKHPCPNPECRRIIKVPELEVKKKKDWRTIDTRAPAGARSSNEPPPEGAWGSTSARGVSQGALIEAGVVAEAGPDLPLYYRIRPYLAIGIVAALLLAGAWGLWAWLAGDPEARTLAQARAVAQSESGAAALGSLGSAGFHLGVGDHARLSRKPKSAEQARTEYSQTLNVLGTGQQDERDPLLSELALAWIELGGDDQEVRDGVRLPWPEVQRNTRTVLAAIHVPEARLNALRRVVRRLLARDQAQRVLPLTAQVFSTPGPEQLEAIARAGIELAVAGKKDEAGQAADQVLAAFNQPGERPALQPGVVALALTLDRAAPEPGPGSIELENQAIGRAEGLSRQGKGEEARKVAADIGSTVGRLRARAAIARAAVDAKSPDAQDIVKAVLGEKDSWDKVTKDLKRLPRAERVDFSFFMLSVVELALQAGVGEDAILPLIAFVPDGDVRAWAQLALVRTRLAAAKGVVEPTVLDTVESGTLAAALARQALVRHNVRQDSGWGRNAQNPDDVSRTFHLLGVAQGLQKR
jgi:hypothetical protein